MNLQEYIQQRMTELPKLGGPYPPQGGYRAAWLGFFQEPLPSPESRVAFFCPQTGGKDYYHEYPKDRILYFDSEGFAHIYGVAVAKPVEWNIVGPKCAEALKNLFNSYKQLADSGDAGNWRIEDEPEGQAALEALSAVYPDIQGPGFIESSDSLSP